MEFLKPLIIEHADWTYLRLELEEHALHYTNGNKETVIPISSVCSLTIKDVRGPLRPGTITINIGSSNDGYVGVGNFAFGFGNDIVMVFNKEYSQIAYKMRDYIMSYNSRGVVPSISTADELRKFKQLYDEKIITQDEYEAKKASLLK